MSKFLTLAAAGLLALTLFGSNAFARGHHSGSNHRSLRTTNLSSQSTRRLTHKQHKTKHKQKQFVKNNKKNIKKKKHHHKHKHKHRSDGDDGDMDGDDGDSDAAADNADATDSAAADDDDSGSAVGDEGDAEPEDSVATVPETADSAGDTSVLLNVRVPADATVWMDDNPTQQTGTFRRFATPPLTPGQDYGYDIRARWVQNGQTVERTRHITVHAGDRRTIDFLAPSGQ